jgi:peptide/nickel transport system ATP-binding protein
VRHDQVTLTGIPGRPPSLVNPPAGCRFRDRCPFAFAKCTETPPFQEIKPGHLVACWKVSQEHADMAGAGQGLPVREKV